MNFKPGDKKNFKIKTVVDGRGISFTPEGDVVMIMGVLPHEENTVVLAEITEVHTKTIIAKKTAIAPPSMPENNDKIGYELDEGEEGYEEDAHLEGEEDEEGDYE